MRLISFMVAALVLAAAPCSAAPRPQEQDGERAEQPRGERWDERWQGRRHWLYDEVQAASDDATDGHAANAQAHCRDVRVRVKRSDGSTAIRRIDRCE